MQDKAQDPHSEPKTIPDKLSGTVQPQYVRCGKPNCKRAHGELHGPYWYRIWRDEGGTQHKEYVRKPDLERVRAACEAHRQELHEAQAILARGRKMVESHADYEASIRKCYGNLEELIAYLYEPLLVAEEIVQLGLSHKGGIMVMIESLRLLTDLYGLICLPEDKPRAHRPPSDDLYTQIISPLRKVTGSSGSATVTESAKPR
jgi:hypothetical protein